MRWEKWEAMGKEGGPGKRWGHTCNAVKGGKQFYVFGGYGQNNSQTNQVHVFDTDTQMWSEPAIKDTPPTPRDSHTCTTVGDNLFVFGGTDGMNPLGDLHVLNTYNLVWKELNTSGQLMPPRAGHSTVAFGKHIFVFGGFTDAQNLYDDLYMLNVDAGIWTQIIPSGDGPSARFSISGDCLDPSKGGVLVFIGGCNKNLEALDDMYYLHTELLRDDGRDEQRLEKLSLRKQLKLNCQQQYVASPDNDKALVTADLISPISVPRNYQQSQHYIHLNMYQPPVGKRTFQAKVSKSFASGYSIETIIDGKPLCGILFSTSSAANLSLHGVNEIQDSIKISSTIHEAPAVPTNASVTTNAEHPHVGQSQEVAIRESENSNANLEIKITAGAAASAELVTLENPSSMSEDSDDLPTGQETQVDAVERR